MLRETVLGVPPFGHQHHQQTVVALINTVVALMPIKLENSDWQKQNLRHGRVVHHNEVSKKRRL
jgi:hypothetical protein